MLRAFVAYAILAVLLIPAVAWSDTYILGTQTDRPLIIAPAINSPASLASPADSWLLAYATQDAIDEMDFSSVSSSDGVATDVIALDWQELPGVTSSTATARPPVQLPGYTSTWNCYSMLQVPIDVEEFSSSILDNSALSTYRPLNMASGTATLSGRVTNIPDQYVGNIIYSSLPALWGVETTLEKIGHSWLIVRGDGTFTVAPEPSTLLLVLVAGAVLATSRIRRPRRIAP